MGVVLGADAVEECSLATIFMAKSRVATDCKYAYIIMEVDGRCASSSKGQDVGRSCCPFTCCQVGLVTVTCMASCSCYVGQAIGSYSLHGVKVYG